MSLGYQLSKTDTHICSMQQKGKNAWLSVRLYHSHTQLHNQNYLQGSRYLVYTNNLFKKHNIPKSRVTKSNRFRQIKMQLITLQNISSLNKRIQSCFYW